MPFFTPQLTVHIAGRMIDFVFDAINENSFPHVTQPDDSAASTYIGDVLHSQVLVGSGGVTAFRWT